METKFKVGDKVRVMSLEWYNKQNKDANGDIDISSGCSFLEEMSKYCGSVLEIKGIETYHCSYTVYNNIWSWQDWMLEDEAVTEEKQEVEQLNKNNMETKEMTKEEVLDYLKDKKFICKSKEERSSVFSKLETLGIEVPNMSDFAFMFFIEEKFGLTYTDSVTYWIEDNKKSIEVSEILSIDIEIEKPKFDSNTLQPFDKVLVRDGGGWRCDYFSHIDEVNGQYPIICVGSCWRFCIPYNDETKQLLGTTDEAPEFYRLDKNLLSL